MYTERRNAKSVEMPSKIGIYGPKSVAYEKNNIQWNIFIVTSKIKIKYSR